MKPKYVIVDWAGNRMFIEHKFDTPEDACNFLLEQFPVIYHEDGTQDDRDEELEEFHVTVEPDEETQLKIDISKYIG